MVNTSLVCHLGAKRASRETGATMVEMSLALVVFLLLFSGVIEYSNLIYINHVVQDAVNTQTRKLMVSRDFNPSAITDEALATVRTQIKSKLPNSPVFSEFKKDENITLSSPDDGTGQVMVQIVVSGGHGMRILGMMGLKTVKITGSTILPYATNYPEPIGETI